jgi:hypothetical protein
MLMAENVRSGFVWQTFMKNPEAQRGMERAGFKPYSASPTTKQPNQGKPTSRGPEPVKKLP